MAARQVAAVDALDMGEPAGTARSVTHRFQPRPGRAQRDAQHVDLVAHRPEGRGARDLGELSGDARLRLQPVGHPEFDQHLDRRAPSALGALHQRVEGRAQMPPGIRDPADEEQALHQLHLDRRRMRHPFGRFCGPRDRIGIAFLIMQRLQPEGQHRLGAEALAQRGAMAVEVVRRVEGPDHRDRARQKQPERFQLFGGGEQHHLAQGLVMVAAPAGGKARIGAEPTNLSRSQSHAPVILSGCRAARAGRRHGGARERAARREETSGSPPFRTGFF